MSQIEHRTVDFLPRRRVKLWERGETVFRAILILGFWIGFLILFLIYGKRIGRLISMKLEKSYYTSYRYTHKRRHKKKLESILMWIAVALIILGILAIPGVFN